MEHWARYKNITEKKFIQLIIPYFVFSELFSMFIYVGYKIPRIASLMSNFGTKKKFIETIIDVMLFRNMYFESLWFVYTLFIIFILNYILCSFSCDLGHFSFRIYVTIRSAER